MKRPRQASDHPAGQFVVYPLSLLLCLFDSHKQRNPLTSTQFAWTFGQSKVQMLTLFVDHSICYSPLPGGWTVRYLCARKTKPDERSGELELEFASCNSIAARIRTEEGIYRMVGRDSGNRTDPRQINPPLAKAHASSSCPCKRDEITQTGGRLATRGRWR